MSQSVKTDFLKDFYQAEEVAYDSLFSKHLKKKEKKEEVMGVWDKILPEKSRKERSQDGSAWSDTQADLFLVDSLEWKEQEKRSLSKRTKMALFLLLIAIPITVLIGMYFFRNTAYNLDQSILQKIFGSRIYYFLSLVIMIYALIPFFMVFEGRKPQARELVVLATMIALNCAGRAAFFMIPDFKPIYAITIISGIAFGGESGFLVGAMSMLVSNFIFGQGPWTPWQMFAMGLIGFLSGILYETGYLPTRRLPLSIFGFLMGFLVYGGIMNPASMFMSIGEPNWKTLLAYYISGVPVDLVKGVSTFLFLWVGAKPMLEKLQRIKVKYGLIR
ncbi:MAG: ECF transporter S component [Eubacteriales bacterium]|nr:ECF transporter S component [Eubacteriales bacterium]